MNFQSIEYIIATANEKSITRAAKKLHITQQTLSAHISSVERELGCALFIRHVPLEITYAGNEFLKYAENIQQQMKGMKRTINEIIGEEKGLLKIGVSDNRDRIVLLPIIVDFLKKHSGIQIKVIEDTNEAVIQKLLKGETDICISNFSSQRGSIHQRSLYQERVVFVIRKDLFAKIYHQQAETVMKSVEQGNYQPLQQCPLLVGHEQDISGRFSRNVIESFEKQPDILVEAENMGLVLGLCAEGLGGCFCPEIIVKNTLTEKQLEHVLIMTLGQQSEYTIRLGWKNSWSVINAFVETACEQIKHVVNI